MAGLLDAIPFVGPAIGAVGGIVSGIEEMVAAGKQRKQAAALRDRANLVKPDPLALELMQKYRASLLASQGNAPGYQGAQNMLYQNLANHLRAIHQSSPDGASALNAMNTALYGANEATNKLGIANEDYQAGVAKENRGDLGVIAAQRYQQGRDAYQKQSDIYKQANALEAAGTANKQTGINTLTGSISSGLSAAGTNALEQDKNTKQMNFLNNLYGSLYGNKNSTNSTGPAYNLSGNSTDASGNPVSREVFDYKSDIPYGSSLWLNGNI